MDKKIQSEIDNLFVRRDERLRKQAAESEQRRVKEEEFLGGFRKLRAEVIKPALQELSDYVKGKGLNASVEENEETQDSEGRTRAAAISIVFTLPETRGYARTSEYPNVSFRASRSEMRVTVGESTIGPGRGGHSGGAGSFQLQEVTKELVREKTLAVLREIIS